MSDRGWGLMPEEVIERLREREWGNRRTLKARLKEEKPFPVSISLKPPRGKEAVSDLKRFHRFVSAWRAFPEQSCVHWENRSFRQLSSQNIPVRFLVSDIELLAGLLGKAERAALADWEERISRILAEPFARGDGVQHELFVALVENLEVLETFSDDDLTLFVRLIPQLRPGLGGGTYLRALPVVHVDTKFIEQNYQLIERLTDVVYFGDVSASGGLMEWLNCRENPKGWLFVRPLCGESRSALGGLPILQMDTDTLLNFELPARNILVVENVQSGLALPSLENTIAVFGGGKNVSWLSASWLESKRVAYWGDIDSEGFRILGDARSRCLTVRSIMMDEATVNAFNNRMVGEPESARLRPRCLERQEAVLLQKLREGHFGKRRLEQERLSSNYIARALTDWAVEIFPG